MKLETLPGIQDSEWDRNIVGCQGSLIYHHAAWLKFITAIRPDLRLIRYRLMSDNKVRGYFAGFLEKKGPLLILGSPLYGCFTDFMGPISDNLLDVEIFLNTLESWCQKERVHFLQLAHPFLSEKNMCRKGYVVNRMSVYSIPLSRSENAMWQHITGKCRNRIRKGQKNGLRVEICTDISIVEDFFAQHKDVFTHQGLPLKYSFKTVYSLVQNLMPAGMLLAIRIRYKDQTIATGLFPHDNRYLYSFGIASWVKYRHLCPNELLYWRAMKWGGNMGLQSFNIGGKYRQPTTGGVFKEKFNGELIPVLRYVKAMSPLLGIAYRSYSFLREMASLLN
jgi:hypothetical protein